MVHSLGHKLPNCPLPVLRAKEDTELPLRIRNGNVESHDPEESLMKISRHTGKNLGELSLQGTQYEKALKVPILGARTFLLIFTANCHR